MNVLSITSYSALLIILFTIGFAPFMTQDAFAVFAVEETVTVCDANSGTDITFHLGVRKQMRPSYSFSHIEMKH